MDLKISGLKVDVGGPPSAKAISQKANKTAVQIAQEEDPEKKERLKEKERKL